MKFEYDPNKSISNKEKHGIDFEHAQLLWADEKRVLARANDAKEARYMVIGTIHEKHWTAIATNRNETIRIISVRRSRKEEVCIYEEQNHCRKS